MVLILIAMLAVTIISAWISVNGSRIDFLDSFVAPVFTGLGLLCLVAYSVSVWEYIAAEYKVNIINREYKTSYTQLEVFYASDVIETIQEINRKRIEVNGDLITGK